jgi:hypothetical protein
MVPRSDFLLYFVWTVRDMIRGADMDDGDYGEDDYDEWFEVVDDPEQDEGTNLDVEEGSDDDYDDNDYFPEDGDLMEDLYC